MNITKTDRHALERIYASAGRCGWAPFEEFVNWSLENKWCPRMTLYKLSPYKSHGPDNSFWYWKNLDLPETENPLCLACDRKRCPGTQIGCKEWRDAFIKKWNEEICRKPKESKPKTKEYFRYEHPDMVREGIVFEGSGSM